MFFSRKMHQPNRTLTRVEGWNSARAGATYRPSKSTIVVLHQPRRQGGQETSFAVRAGQFHINELGLAQIVSNSATVPEHRPRGTSFP